MVYDICIEIAVSHEGVYAPLLKNNEAVSGDSNLIEFKITNIGEIFPGGIIEKIDFNTTIGMGQLTQDNNEDRPVPKLKKNEEYIFEFNYVPMISGLSVISLEIVMEGDDEKINYYQSPIEASIDGDNFIQVIPVIDRHLLEIERNLQQCFGKSES